MILDDFLVRAIIVGLGIALVSGVLGCFIVWKKMAYFGDSLAHSALLGVLLGTILQWDMHIGIFLVCLVFVVILLWLQHKNILAFDTLLGLLAHTGLSLAIVGLSLFPNPNIDLHSLLFGDILTANNQDIYLTYSVAIFVLGVIFYSWNKLVLLVVHEDLARAEGINVFFYNILFMILMSLVVAISFRIIGVLLITSMLIIPPATSRLISSSPEMMAIVSVFVGIVGIIGGVLASSIFDIPSGPSIVLVLAGLFVVFSIIRRR